MTNRGRSEGRSQEEKQGEWSHTNSWIRQDRAGHQSRMGEGEGIHAQSSPAGQCPKPPALFPAKPPPPKQAPWQDLQAGFLAGPYVPLPVGRLLGLVLPVEGEAPAPHCVLRGCWRLLPVWHANVVAVAVVLQGQTGSTAWVLLNQEQWWWLPWCCRRRLEEDEEQQSRRSSSVGSEASKSTSRQTAKQGATGQ